MKAFIDWIKYFRLNLSSIITLLLLMTNSVSFSQTSAEDSLFEQANYYLSIGYYDSAVNSLKKLLEINPKSAAAYSSLGNAFSFQGKYEQAILMYRKCIEIDSTFLFIYENLGNAYIDAGKLDSAIAIHKFLIAKDSLMWHTMLTSVMHI